MGFSLQMDALPRTIELVRDAHGQAALIYVDQRKLPAELIFERTDDWRVVVHAIETLAVRGAPAIGVAGASALALWTSKKAQNATDLSHYREELLQVAETIAAARPTAINLRWAVQKVLSQALSLLEGGASVEVVSKTLIDAVKHMEQEDEAVNRLMGQQGTALLGAHSRILTHCNAGSLATVFYGTALGVVYAAAVQGKIEHVYADETRPVGQGARLTVWELAKAGVPCTLICDNMAASLMAQGETDAVLVGADRIAANGDVANKIGTYSVAVLARYHHIPFYVVAPSSTFDFSLADGSEIPIEERPATEVAEQPIEGVGVWNPAFDVTPAHLITRIVTEQGVFEPSKLLY